MVIKLLNDVNPTEAFGDIQRLIILSSQNLCCSTRAKPAMFAEACSCRSEFGL